MRLWRFGGGVAALCIAAAMLSDCSGLSSQVMPSGPQSPQGFWRPATRVAEQGSSWMAPEAKNEDLLYVSAQNGVFAYSYPQGAKVGQLVVSTPGGECSDAKGDIFVADIAGAKVLEFAHGSRTPTATLQDTGYAPASCAVNPKTGDIAVTNYQTATGGPGNLVVYANGQGMPRLFVKNNTVQNPYFCAFDKAGDLFIDGLNGDSSAGFEELRKGSISFVPIELNRHIVSPGGVQMIGNNVGIADNDQGIVFAFAIRGTDGSAVSQTTLKGAQGGLAEFVVEGGTVVAANGYLDTTGFWPYPAGGNATKMLSGLTGATGIAISNAK